MKSITALVFAFLFSFATLWSEFVSSEIMTKIKEGFGLSPETKTACKDYFTSILPAAIMLMVVAMLLGFCFGIIRGQIA